MRVKVRLESASPFAENWQDEFGPRLLSQIFTRDPLVSLDEVSYFVSAKSLDEADDDPDVDFFAAAKRLVEALNGTTALLTTAGLFRPVRLTGHYEGNRSAPPPPAVILSGYLIPAADVSSAPALLEILQEDPTVRRMLSLVSTAIDTRVWFDLWRVIDILRDLAAGKGQKLEDWIETVVSRSEWVRFKRTNNDPSYGGRDKRHTSAAPAADTAGNPMSQDEGVNLVRRLVAAYIDQQYGVHVDLQLPGAPLETH